MEQIFPWLFLFCNPYIIGETPLINNIYSKSEYTYSKIEFYFTNHRWYDECANEKALILCSYHKLIFVK